MSIYLVDFLMHHVHLRPMSIFASFLKRSGLSHRDFAKKVQVDPSIISRLTTGKMTPSLKLAAKIERTTQGEIRATSWINEDVRKGDIEE